MAHNPLVLLAIHRLPGHNGFLKKRIVDLCRDETSFNSAVNAALLLYSRLRPKRSRAALPSADRLKKQAELDWRRLEASRTGFRVLGEAGYPPLLAHIDDPPFLLFVRGHLPDNVSAQGNVFEQAKLSAQGKLFAQGSLFEQGELSAQGNVSAQSSQGPAGKPAVALVGTRRPSASALREAYRLALEFSLAEYPVVSGLAFGIDKAAHEGALDGPGPTWAVLAGGVDSPGPRSHRRLAARILEKGGALIGEMPPGEFPSKYAFPRRNRILSGLCRGCVVVQAPEKSGALITAAFALDQNRDVYVARSGLEGQASGGSRALEEQGAPVISSASDIMRDWGCHETIRRVKQISLPETPGELAGMMRQEMDGRLRGYMGGWFAY